MRGPAHRSVAELDGDEAASPYTVVPLIARSGGTGGLAVHGGDDVGDGRVGRRPAYSSAVMRRVRPCRVGAARSRRRSWRWPRVEACSGCTSTSNAIGVRNRQIEACQAVAGQIDLDTAGPVRASPPHEASADDDLRMRLGRPCRRSAVRPGVDSAGSARAARRDPIGRDVPDIVLAVRWPSCTACSITERRSSARSERARSNTVRTLVVSSDAVRLDRRCQMDGSPRCDRSQPMCDRLDSRPGGPRCGFVHRAGRRRRPQILPAVTAGDGHIGSSEAHTAAQRRARRYGATGRAIRAAHRRVGVAGPPRVVRPADACAASVEQLVERDDPVLPRHEPLRLR